MDQKNWTHDNGNPRDGGDPNASKALNAGLAFALFVLFASFGPRELLWLTLSGFFTLGGMIAASGAWLTREPVWVDRLTEWDVAAVFFLLGVCVSWLIDPETVNAFMEANRFAAPPAGTRE